jgi:hypothetical protein
MTAQYEPRYFAYVDILGFRGLMADLRNGKVKCEAIRDVLKRMHTPHDPEIIDVEHCDFRAQSISDAVALSTKPTIPGLMMLLATLRQLATASLREGYFTRGAVCKGLLYHDESTVFGDALVEAYRLESEIVKYPRIMLTKVVVDDARGSEKKDEFEEHIKQADDGPYFVHVLWRLRMLLDVLKEQPRSPEQHRQTLSYFEAMRAQIQKRFEESVDTPAHFKKVRWFANYWNVTLGEDVETIQRITGP